MKIQYKLDKISGKKIPTERLLFSYGANKTTKGTFYMTEESAKQIMDSYKDYGNKLVFDYNHQQLADVQTPESAVSAGTYDLELRATGIYAVNIDWTEKAKAMIMSKEYIYTSPAFITQIREGRETIIEVINCALTNIPATKSMDQLMAASKLAKGKLNMEPITDEEKVDQPVEEEKLAETPPEDLQAKIDELLAIIENKDSLVKQLEEKVAELQGESGKMEEDLQCKDQEIAKLSKVIESSTKEKIVTLAITDGKILPAQKDLYMSLDTAVLQTEVNKLSKSVLLNKTQEIQVIDPEKTEVQKLTAYINKKVFGI